jgi:hypothetical protein
MPVELLTNGQVATYGRFEGSPTRAELERSFFLNDADRELVEQRRRDPNRLGFGVQLGTVRFLGAFLADQSASHDLVRGVLNRARPSFAPEARELARRIGLFV